MQPYIKAILNNGIVEYIAFCFCLIGLMTLRKVISEANPQISKANPFKEGAYYIVMASTWFIQLFFALYLFGIPFVYASKYHNYFIIPVLWTLACVIVLQVYSLIRKEPVKENDKQNSQGEKLN